MNEEPRKISDEFVKKDIVLLIHDPSVPRGDFFISLIYHK